MLNTTYLDLHLILNVTIALPIVCLAGECVCSHQSICMFVLFPLTIMTISRHHIPKVSMLHSFANTAHRDNKPLNISFIINQQRYM